MVKEWGKIVAKMGVFIFRLILLLVGSIVGIGFISGAEIYQFFVKFEVCCVFGIILFFTLMFLLVYKIFYKKFYNQKHPKTHKILTCQNDVKMKKNNKKHHKNTILIKNQIENFLIIASTVALSGAMFSGLRNIIFELFENNFFAVYVLSILFIFYITLKGVLHLDKVNVVMLFLLLSFLLFLIFDTFDSKKILSANFGVFGFENITKSLSFSLVYVFMNIVPIEHIVNEFDLKFSRRQVLIYSFFVAFILTLVLIVFALFLFANKNIQTYSMPLLVYFEKKGGVVLIFFILTLLLGLFSTMISCLIGIKRVFILQKFTVFSSTFCAVLLSVVLGLIDFSVYVKIIYPIIGVMNFIIYVFL